MARRRLLSKQEAAQDQRASLAAVAGAFKRFRPASETLTHVRAVPTIFPQYDHATRVGGHPTERVTLVHGPSGQGKTTYTLGILRSHIERAHFAVLIDAERTTPKPFVDLAMGDAATSPAFFYNEPTTYEATVGDVRDFANTVGALRDKGKVPPETTGLIIVDSIRKLVPEDQFKRIMKATKEGGADDKVRDRSAQIKAAMNAAWMDEVVPLLAQTRCSMIIIARESEDPDADARSRMYGTNYKVGGGKALYYDASMVIRVERAKYITKDNGEGTKPTIYGERHRITIRKSKVAGQEDKQTVCHFHWSNGVLVPEGFDRARDILELARRFGIVKGEGWMKWRSHKWQGEHNAVKKLHALPDALLTLEAEVRERFQTATPLEQTEAVGAKKVVVTDDGEVVE